MLEDENASNCSLTFSVTDTGIGIDKKLHKNLFESFQQADYSTSRMYGGAGLGLSICKKLAQSMRGKIDFDSEVGKGSSFYVSIQLGKIKAKPKASGLIPFEGNNCLFLCNHMLSRHALTHQLKRLGFRVNAESLAQESIVSISNYDILIVGLTNEEIEDYLQDKYSLEFLASLQLPILLLLSTSDRKVIENFHIFDNTWVLSKPLSTGTLELVMRAIFTTEDTSLRPSSAYDATEFNGQSLKGVKILVVDDNEINLKLIRLLLSEKGASVAEARNGEQAIQQTQDGRFDMIIMDIHMPNIKGTEATRRIRGSEPPGIHTPIIALTADALPATRKEVVEAGMDGYLLKPIDTSELWNVIFPLLGKKPILMESKREHPVPQKTDVIPIRDSKKLLLATGGDRQLAQQLFDEFCQELPKDISAIRQLFAQAQWEELVEIVHRLHGSSSICGVPALNVVISELESRCRSKQSDEAKRLLYRLEAEAETLLTYHDPSANSASNETDDP
jgi:two-component system sensor histidine kinase BarA